MTWKQKHFNVRLLSCIFFLFQVSNATDNFKAIGATHLSLFFIENIMELKSGNKKLALAYFWGSILPLVLLLIGTWESIFRE